ncbi:MAG: efflux RND transporter permease subunit [Halioglobus sp.]
MSLAAIAIEKRAITYFVILLLIIGGVNSFFSLGQLEDPEFTIKTAVITTQYPGASAEEVELEVTDRIEVALQELKQLKYVSSWSRAGESVVTVEIKSEYWSETLPQVWDELRRKIRDVQPSLPPGVGEAIISDDFGDVFGFQLAILGDGYSYAQLEKYAKDIKKELSLVEGVARVDHWGLQERVIYLDVAESQLAELGLSDSSIENTLQQQNMVVDAGSVDVQNKRYRIAPTGEFRSPQDIGNLLIKPSAQDSQAGGDIQELTRIRDIATVREGYRAPPFTLLRYNGQPALGISITNIAGVNVVAVGKAIDSRLDELLPEWPVGIEVKRVHWMSDIVDEAVSSFLISFAEALIIVLVVLTIFMGWRMGVVIGSALILTILASFILMSLLGIDLQRMSLGALIIALGMMVDNAIVVADGMAVRLQQGMERRQAAVEAATLPAWPLLGATVVAVMAFYPIFASTEGAGEYCRTLFSVVAIALLTSWVISVTVTPLQCMVLLPDPAPGSADQDPYSSHFYRRFRHIIGVTIRFRWLTLGGMAGLLLLALVGFGNLSNIFFPDSSMTKFMVDVFAPEGTRIQQISAELEEVEKKLLEDDRVESVSAFIGAGPPRFYLPVDPESPNPSYAQLVVNVHDYNSIDDMIGEMEPMLASHMPDNLVGIRKYGVGPSNTWKFEVRISGPAVADTAVLRSLADQGIGALRASPLAGPVRTDWRDPIQRLEPVYSQERARWSSVSREDIARTTKRAFDGRAVGLYRENDELLQIVLRHTEEERVNVNAFDVLQVQPGMSSSSIPLSQVVENVQLRWENPVIARRDRRRTITVQANPVQGATLTELRNAVLDDFAAIDLPPGYKLEWGGEFEDTMDSQSSLLPGMVPTAAVILFIIVALFNSFKQPVVILLTIPFALIGIVAGLLAFNVPFGFVALLGAMALAGMMIKNAVVLLDQVDINLNDGMTSYDAVAEAAVSRLRPVMLAVATTVLGVIPLLQDVFWIGLSVTLMAGLSFGSILTMVIVPVLYATVYRIQEPTVTAPTVSRDGN